MTTRNAVFDWSKRAVSDPAVDGIAFTDAADLDLATTYSTHTRGIYVAADGNLEVVMLGGPGSAPGSTLTFVGVKAGTVLPLCVTKINTAGTTVSGIALL